MISIYKISSPSNKIYIGQSSNIKKRFNNYKNLHCKGQSKLYNSLKKYGWEQHKFEIIHELPEDVTQEIVNTYEDYYLQQYKECKFDAMNIREAGSRGKDNEETKRKKSISLKGKKLGKLSTGSGRKPGFNISIDIRQKMSKPKSMQRTKNHSLKLSKSIIQYDLQNNFIKEWSSINQAQTELNNKSINSCLLGKCKTAGGYLWSYNKIKNLQQ